MLAVASSSPLSYIRNVTEHWGIDRYFQKLVSGETVKHPKPAPDVFLKTAEILGLSQKNVWLSRIRKTVVKPQKRQVWLVWLIITIPGNRI